MTLTVSTLLLFKTKIEEAVCLVPEMVAGEKLKAVQFWNLVSERLQDILNNCAADINVLAMKMTKEGVEELHLIGNEELNGEDCSESGKDFIVSPSFLPPNEYEENSLRDNNHQIVNHGDNHDTMDTITDLPSNLNLKSECPAKALESVPVKIMIVECGDSSNLLPSSPTEMQPCTIEVTAISPSAKGNLPLLNSDLSSSNRKGYKRKRTVLKRTSKKLLHGKLKSDMLLSSDLSKVKRKDLLQEISCSSEEKEDLNGHSNKSVLLENIENEKNEQETTETLLVEPDYSNVLKAFKSPPFICEWCNREFHCASKLRKHRWIHVKPYACSECPSRFPTKGNLTVHQRSHTGEKPFTCDQCDATFTTNSNLRRHVKTHTGEKPWECTQCGKRYSEKKSLNIHLRSHTGEKPFQCPVCLKGFSHAGILQSHMDLHLDKKTYLCDICGKSFRQSSQLRRHKQRHAGVKKYFCGDCPADFLSKGDLERHRRVHTGERPFVCDLCGKTYTRQQSLTEHKNRHYGLRPYECKYCNRTFVEMSARYKHVKDHEKRKKKEGQVHPVGKIQTLPCEGEMTFEVCSDDVKE